MGPSSRQTPCTLGTPQQPLECTRSEAQTVRGDANGCVKQRWTGGYRGSGLGHEERKGGGGLEHGTSPGPLGPPPDNPRTAVLRRVLLTAWGGGVWKPKVQKFVYQKRPKSKVHFVNFSHGDIRVRGGGGGSPPQQPPQPPEMVS